jgi:hypothetical protein
LTFLEFEHFQSRLLTEVEKMGSTKGKEYAFSEKDRFENFNKDAEDLQVSRLLVAYIFTNKHINSLRSYILKGTEMSEEKIMGRIIDIITYLTLIAGMIEEDNSKVSQNPELNVP